MPPLIDKSSSQGSKSKRPKLSTKKKSKARNITKKKRDYIESSDDDFIDPKPGPSSYNHQVQKKVTSEEELKKQRNRDNVARWRANQPAKKKYMDRSKNAAREKARRAAETTEEHQERKLLKEML